MIYHYGVYKEEEILFLWKLILKSKWNSYNKYSNLHDLISDLIYFELGKMAKIRRESITFHEFLSYGRNFIFDSNNFLEIIEYKRLKNIDIEFKNGIYKKYPIFKDATSSGTQHLGRLLEFNDNVWDELTNQDSELNQ